MFKKKTIFFAVLSIVLLFPVIYLAVKTVSVPEIKIENQPSQVLQTNDISALEALVKTNPSFDNLLNLSMAYINGNMPGKSIEYLNKAAEINPNSAVVYNNLGVAYTMLQQYQNGIDACNQALKFDADFQLAKNNLKWATDEKNKILELIQEQENTPVKNRTPEFNIDYGLNYFKIGNYDKSIEIWAKVAEQNPKNTAALNSIGSAFMMKKQVDDAIAIFKQALEMEPNNQLTKNNLSWALTEKQKQ
jgi:tetratricopeptide (TPR) repeat protein